MGRNRQLALVLVIAGAALAAPARADSAAEFGRSQQAAPPPVEEERDGTAPRSDDQPDGAAPKHDDDSEGIALRSGHHTHGIPPRSDGADAPAPKSDDDSDGTVSTRTASPHDESTVPPELESEEPRPAATREDPWTSRPFTLELQLGAGTPIGGIGMAGTYAVADELSFGAGLGVGSGASGAGPHAAVFALLRPFHGTRNALVIDTAFSTGTYERLDFSGAGLLDNPRHDAQSVTADWAHFIQLALGWEYRNRRGTVVRITTGGAWMLNPSARKCTTTSYMTGAQQPCAVGSDGEEMGTFELAIGQAF